MQVTTPGHELGVPPRPDVPQETEPPLVVDLDGTLTPTDTLVELTVQLVRHDPAAAWQLPFWLLRGRAALKAGVAARARFSPRSIPYRDELLRFIEAGRRRGRRTVLATAASQTVADAVAGHLGLFDAAIGSDGQTNLKAERKLEAIQRLVGPDFSYAGDSSADLPIWRAARTAVLVGASRAVSDDVRQFRQVELEIPRSRAGARVWLRQLRAHQWLKNLLVFVPLMTAFAWQDVGLVARAVVAFVAFSLTASATYVLNDIWDLSADRAHPRKRLRPLAAGIVPLASAVTVAFAMLAAAGGLGLWLGVPFAITLVIYLVVTTLYSWILKSLALVDVIVLSALYTIRIMAGSVATGVPASVWLLAFSVFVFLSLALVKRCTELVMVAPGDAPLVSGRGYRREDLVVLWPMGVGAGLCAVVVFTFFVSAPETVIRYGTPQLLWVVDLLFIYWLGRVWMQTARGQMHDDPLVYALRDTASRFVIAGMVAVMLMAKLMRF